MFKESQIVTATFLIRNFKNLTKELLESGEPLLVIQKGGNKFVLLPASDYQRLRDKKKRK